MAAMTGNISRAPDAAMVERLAREAVDRLPAVFRDHLAQVVFRVAENPWELTGLYHGRPLSEQSIWSAGDLPPMISLFRCPLLNEWVETGVTLEELVTHVIVHEVGHHFGLSDAEMEAIEDGRL
jgi:predicted Zn-dependent protease with MMP-like domain